MNSNTNLWAILLVLSLALNGYQYFTAPKTNESKTTPEITQKSLETTDAAADPCKADSIPFRTGLANVNTFVSGRYTFPNTNLINPDVREFVLAKCELQQMLAYTGQRDSVVAQLAILPGQKSQKDTIDLYFKVYNSSNQAKFYDFSRPCPPMCPK
jgi:hypothetical protein